MKNAKNYTRTEVNAIVEKYLLGCIPDNATFEAEYNVITVTDKDRVNYAYNDFTRVSDYPNNLQRFPNIQNRLADFLQGLPGTLQVEFRNYEIIKLAENWGALPEGATEKQQDKIIENWFNYIAFKFLQLHRKVNTPVKPARQRTTEDVYNVLGNYGNGYEIVTAESTLSEAKNRLKEYRENESGIAFKIKKTREKIN